MSVKKIIQITDEEWKALDIQKCLDIQAAFEGAMELDGKARREIWERILAKYPETRGVDCRLNNRKKFIEILGDKK